MAIDFTARGMAQANLISLSNKPQLCGIYESVPAAIMDLCIDKNMVYAAIDSAGIAKYDFSVPENPILSANNDIAPSPYQTYGIVKDGNFLYTASRSAGGAHVTTPSVVLNFDGGDIDLSNGGDGWTNGSKSANAIIVGNSLPAPLGGQYGALITWTSAGSTAIVEKAITGGATNYAEFWVKVNTPTANDADTARFELFDQASNTAYRINFVHKTDQGNITVQMGICDSTGAIQTVTGGTRLSYNTWYLMKCYYKIDAAVGGGTLQYKANIADAWTTLCSKLDMNTTGRTPDKLKMGVVYSSAGYTTGSIAFDEVFFDTADLDTKVYDEGKVDSINVADLSVADTVYFEGKCSDIVKLGNWLVVACQTKGVVVIDAATPTALQVLGSCGYDSANWHIFETQGIDAFEYEGVKYACVAGYWKGLQILNITDPVNISIVSTLDFTDTNATVWDCVVDYPWVYGSKGVTTGSVVGTVNDHRGLVVYNISDPTHPVKYEFEFPTEAKDVWSATDSDARPLKICKKDNYVYLANGTVGITIYDVTDPTNAQYIRSFGAITGSSFGAVQIDQYNRIFAGIGRRTGDTKKLYMYRKFV
jgi:hypothetical protein